MIKYVIWDFDGTLFDTYPVIGKAIQKVLIKYYDYSFSYDEIKKYCCQSMSSCLSFICNKTGFNEKLLKEQVLHEYIMGDNYTNETPYDHVLEVCKYMTSVGGNFIISKRSKESIDRILDQYDASDYFIELVTAENQFSSKPDPSAIDYIIKKYNLPHNEVLCVGDQHIDIEACKDFPLETCFFSPEKLSYSHATYNIHNYLELMEILKV